MMTPDTGKPLRLLTICHMYPSRQLPRHGIFLQRQAEGLKQQGIDCTFLVARPRAPWPLHHIKRWQAYGPQNPLLIGEGTTVETVRYLRPPGRWFRPLEAKAMASVLTPAAQRLHARNPFDAVWACPMIPDAVAAVPVACRLSLPLATLAIGSDVLVYPQQTPSLKNTLRQALTHVDLPIGVSHAVCEQLKAFGAREPQCVYLVRDGQHFTPPNDKAGLRAELGWDEEAVIGVFVGRLSGDKGVADLIEAAAPRMAAASSNFVLVWIGDGPTSEQVALFCANGKGYHTGELVPEDIPARLQAADFLILPSHSEGMPQVVLEAMSCGLPIIATDVGGIPEAVKHEDNGLLVEAQNPVQLSAALERMIHDDAFRRRAGQRSLAIIRERFDRDDSTLKLANALKQLVRQ